MKYNTKNLKTMFTYRNSFMNVMRSATKQSTNTFLVEDIGWLLTVPKIPKHWMNNAVNGSKAYFSLADFVVMAEFITGSNNEIALVLYLTVGKTIIFQGKYLAIKEGKQMFKYLNIPCVTRVVDMTTYNNYFAKCYANDYSMTFGMKEGRDFSHFIETYHRCIRAYGYVHARRMFSGQCSGSTRLFTQNYKEIFVKFNIPTKYQNLWEDVK